MTRSKTTARSGRPLAAAAGSTLPAAVEALVQGEHGDPFGLLGLHDDLNGGLVLRAFLPEAEQVEALEAESGRTLGTLEKIHPAGFFVLPLGNRGRLSYRFRVRRGGEERLLDDPYRFGPLLGELDAHLLAEGNHLRLYERLGAHPVTHEGVAGVGFVLWAPNAQRVSIVGPFNAWDGRVNPMRRRPECGAWEIFLPAVEAAAPYKYEIKGARAEMLPLKADPVAFAAERRPATASIVHGLPRHDWNDGLWLETRAQINARTHPISIYEVHLGSWMRNPEEGERMLTYRELADRLVPYVKEMGFTHIELLPVSEHPFDGSWGYQPIGLFAPTSRHGTPEDFADFVERCHQQGLGLLLDWVPGHFPTDPHGLGYFDGTHLYEHADPRQGFHQDWNTLIYNFGRREVANFLYANALFWLKNYHIDGLRVDAVASMLYLDYSRQPGEWVPNPHGGRENLDAIAFLRRLNQLAYGEAPGIMTAAEESTAWPGVSRPVEQGGLGFGYKWNMGWMHDTLSYIREDPVYRRWHHHKMTFGLIYAFSENFILPLSHDEVVHGKGSLLGKMPGDRWQRFANLRAYYGFMFAHPGKKLLFMGGEFGQEREWSHDRSLDWHLLDDPAHRGLHLLLRDLNRLYRELPALHEQDCEPQGFAWVEGGDRDNSVYAWLRYGFDRSEPVLAVSNFTPVPRSGYRVGVPAPGFYREVFNSDAAIYGGSNIGNSGGLASEPVSWHGHPFSLSLTLPPLATVMFQRRSG